MQKLLQGFFPQFSSVLQVHRPSSELAHHIASTCAVYICPCKCTPNICMSLCVCVCVCVYTHACMPVCVLACTPTCTQTASNVAFSINLQKTPGILKLEMEVKNLCLFLSSVEMGFCLALFCLTFSCELKMSVPWVGKIPWRRAWQPIPVFLPREFRGQRSLVGYSPWNHKVRYN